MWAGPEICSNHAAKCDDSSSCKAFYQVKTGKQTDFKQTAMSIEHLRVLSCHNKKKKVLTSGSPHMPFYLLVAALDGVDLWLGSGHQRDEREQHIDHCHRLVRTGTSYAFRDCSRSPQIK
jgi:hypothetical protein